MDSQQIKEALAADPYTTDEALIAAVEADSELLQYWQELKQLNDDIIAASKVAIPEGLEAKLLQIGANAAEDEIADLEAISAANGEQDSTSDKTSNVVSLDQASKQAAPAVRRHKKRNYFAPFAMAASLAIAAILSINVVNRPSEYQSGSEIALAHLYHELDYLETVSLDVSLDDVNAKLATFGGAMTQKVGRVKFSNFCYFEKQKSLHLVIETDQGDITLFITPEDLQNKIDPHFSDDRFEGRSWKTQQADVTIIGEKGKVDRELERRIKNSMQFSA